MKRLDTSPQSATFPASASSELIEEISYQKVSITKVHLNSIVITSTRDWCTSPSDWKVEVQLKERGGISDVGAFTSSWFRHFFVPEVQQKGRRHFSDIVAAVRLATDVDAQYRVYFHNDDEDLKNTYQNVRAWFDDRPREGSELRTPDQMQEYGTYLSEFPECKITESTVKPAETSESSSGNHRMRHHGSATRWHHRRRHRHHRYDAKLHAREEQLRYLVRVWRRDLAEMGQISSER